MRRNEHSQIKNKPRRHHRHGLAQLIVVCERSGVQTRGVAVREVGLKEPQLNRHAKSSKRLVGAEAGAGSRGGVPDSLGRGTVDNQMERVVRHLNTHTQRERGTVGDA